MLLFTQPRTIFINKRSTSIVASDGCFVRTENGEWFCQKNGLDVLLLGSDRDRLEKSYLLKKYGLTPNQKKAYGK